MKITSKSEIRTITPAIANTFLMENHFHLQRTPKPSHVSSLAGAMRNGEFPPGTPICFVQTPTKLELIDGQHRLRAQVVAEMDVDYSVVTLTSDDETASGVLYTQFDIGAKRTITDRLKALNVTEHVDLPVMQANLLAAGAPYLKYRFGKISSSQIAQMTPLQRLEILKEFEQGAIQFFACMSSAEKWISKPLMKPHFVALGAYLCQYAPAKAIPLWRAIAANTCGGINDPQYHMFNLAQNVDTKSVAQRRAVVIAQAFIHGWNAIVEGKSISKKLTPAPVPSEAIEILGVDDDWTATPKAAEKKAVKTEAEIAKSVIENIAMLFPQTA